MANAYRGELLGLMAVHLLLLAVNRVNPGLNGSTYIYLDCLGALGRVAELPPGHIPTRCRHSDILKNILVNCTELTFARTYAHVRAHQDNHRKWQSLSRPAQLNTFCDAEAKDTNHEQGNREPRQQQRFPLEPICMMVLGEKVTSDTGAQVWFAAQQKLAKEFFGGYDVLSAAAFEQVDWQHVSRMLRDEVPRLFQVWTCKQVMRLAPTNALLSHRDRRSRKCPCCVVEDGTAAHILHCEEVGWVDAFQQMADGLELWLEDVDTDPELTEVIMECVRARGLLSIAEVCEGLPGRFQQLGRSQDIIGWQRMLEGMVSVEFARLQEMHMRVIGSRWSVQRWMSGFITRLLEITHRQWIYRNLLVHDTVSGMLLTLKKEELRREIETQQELGDEGLLEEDKFLAEVNLECLETTSGEHQTYWLLAIRAARKAKLLREQQDGAATVWPTGDG